MFFTSVAIALAEANQDQAAADQALKLGALALNTVLMIAEQVDAHLSGCGQATAPSCKAGEGPGPSKRGNSFAEGTPVLTSEGLMPIEDVPVGALVASWDPATDTSVMQKVTGKSSRLAPGILHLTVKDDQGRIETVKVTPNHP